MKSSRRRLSPYQIANECQFRAEKWQSGLRRLVPSAINLATRMIKTTSLVMLINVVEVLKVGQQIIEATSLFTGPTVSLWVYGCIFLLYFIICYPISLVSKKLANKWADE